MRNLKYQPREVLTTHFGFERFLPGQEAIIADVLNGKHVVAVQPTGAGKSLCYQLPALCLGKLTLIVSPLISLMHDQIKRLHDLNIRAATLNSAMTAAEKRSIEQLVLKNQLHCLYISPERFTRRDFQQLISQVEVGVLAIDEAHCVSEWGHDFRPTYQFLKVAINQVKPHAVLACTATATPQVIDDIHVQLGLKDAQLHRSSFLKANLNINVVVSSTETDRNELLITTLERFVTISLGQVIIYANTRKRTEAVYRLLKRSIPNAQIDFYHAGRSEPERRTVQTRFNEGACRLLVATNAFGLGIDHPHVNCIIHVDTPRNIAQYYQEVGRAGRNGQYASAILFHRKKDIGLSRFMIEVNHPSQKDCHAVWNELNTTPSTPYPMIDLFRLAESRKWRSLNAILRLFERTNLIQIDALDHICLNPSAPVTLNDWMIDWNTVEAHYQHAQAELNQVRRFVKQNSCLHQFLLQHFADDNEKLHCPGCSNCSGVDVDQPLNQLHELIYQAIANHSACHGATTTTPSIRENQTREQPTESSLVDQPKLGHLLESTIRQAVTALIEANYLQKSPSDSGHLALGPRVPIFRHQTFKPLARKAFEAELNHIRIDIASSRLRTPGQLLPKHLFHRVCETLPTTKEEFLAIPGLGLTRWNDYGEELIEKIGRHLMRFEQKDDSVITIGDIDDHERNLPRS